MIEPDMSWRWQCSGTQLQLISDDFCQWVTPLQNGQWRCDDAAFTLQHAEWFYQTWFALEPLHWPHSALLAATTDAIARLSFCAGIMSRNFYLKPIAGHWQPQPLSLVELAGQHYALALVLRVHAGDVDLMLLSPLETITGKQLTAGQVFNCRYDRITPYQPHVDQPRLTA